MQHSQYTLQYIYIYTVYSTIQHTLQYTHMHYAAQPTHPAVYSYALCNRHRRRINTEERQRSSLLFGDILFSIPCWAWYWSSFIVVLGNNSLFKKIIHLKNGFYIVLNRPNIYQQILVRKTKLYYSFFLFINKILQLNCNFYYNIYSNVKFQVSLP